MPKNCSTYIISTIKPLTAQHFGPVLPDFLICGFASPGFILLFSPTATEARTASNRFHLLLILFAGYTASFYTLAEGIMIFVRSWQRSEGDVSDPIKYIYS